ncbi:MAG: protein jag [Clostridia bacterium]|nr:protein jag [Clostridia bacterium]
MKKEIIITGKTTEEALKKAAEELGAQSADELTYEVIEEAKKGIFGIGATPAKIKATYTVKGDAIALDFIKELIANMQLKAEVTMTSKAKDERLINIDGEDAGALIGHHGDTLDSLQYLANLAANKKFEGEKREYVKITVDIEGYRAKREETLRALARRMADKVLRYKKSVMFEPMSPYERRIIHSEVQNIAGVSTNSIGSENNRKIVIYLCDEKKDNYAKKNDILDFDEE